MLLRLPGQPGPGHNHARAAYLRSNPKPRAGDRLSEDLVNAKRQPIDSKRYAWLSLAGTARCRGPQPNMRFGRNSATSVSVEIAAKGGDHTPPLTCGKKQAPKRGSRKDLTESMRPRRIRTAPMASEIGNVAGKGWIMAYAKTFTDGLQFQWGEGFLSPGGPEEIALIFAGTDLHGLAVLDIGSGLGGIDLLLAQRFGAARVTGIDIEPDLVEQARHLADRQGLADRVEFQVVQPGPLPFPDASFDVVFSKDAMVHVSDKLALYREIRRVLRPGGLLCAADWFWAQGAEDHPAVRDWVITGPLHFAYTTPQEAREALLGAGLQEISLVNRQASLQQSNRELVARLHGPDLEQLSALVGPDSARARQRSAVLRQAALDDGQLIPCHIRARAPQSGT